VSDLEKSARQKYVASSTIAMIYTGLGDRDEAFRWLSKALDDRDDALAYLKVDPTYDSLRSDPRWTVLVQRLKLNLKLRDDTPPVTF